MLWEEPRSWHERIVANLATIRFFMAYVEQSIYVQNTETSNVIICICMGDLFIGGDHVANIDHVKIPRHVIKA